MIVLAVIIAVVALLVWLDRVDTRRCAKVNAPIAGRAIASRAKTLGDCPPAFLAQLQAVLDAQDGDAPPQRF